MIVVLNGAPRSGKSSIAAAIQETVDGLWMNIGVDCGIYDALVAPDLEVDMSLLTPRECAAKIATVIG